MDSIQHIKSRLGAVKNIGTITKAMEVVSATKMRRAQGLALNSRPYAFAAFAALADVLKYAPSEHLETAELVAKREVKTTLVVLVASDRGLAGAFNSSVTRTAEQFIKADLETGFPSGNGNPVSEKPYKLVLVGKKLASFAQKSKLPVEMMFTEFGDYANHEEISPLSSLVVEGYRAGKWDRVVVISTHFKTTLAQFTVTREVLPMHIDQIRETVREIVPEHGRFSEYRTNLLNPEDSPQAKERLTDYLFEPSPAAVLSSILPHLLGMQLLHLVLEANASEHSARMVAMKNASENSKELSESLNLTFNKARQASITKEMIEITSAQVAAN